MHLHADHALFFERRQSRRVAGASLALACFVLVINAGARSAPVSLVAAVLGGVLLLLNRARGRGRLEPALLWTLGVVVLALIASTAMDSNAEAVVQTALRVLCGVIWVLWLGTQLDWASLRDLLLQMKVPEGVVGTLDHALMHGIFTKREWVQRRDAARVRLGSNRLPLTTWGTLMGEGALHAFTRLERAEEGALLRSTQPSQASEEAPQTDALQLSGVDLNRSGQLVLQQLELRLGRSEWLLVCGPSGAGKTSLLRALAGLDPLASGSMVRLGRSLDSKATLSESLDGRVALLGQNPAEHFIASTVAEDIAWGLLRRGVDAAEAERRSREVCEALRIDHLLHRPCHQLSFGEQRRAALAGLLVLEPALLLLDEPTAGLDPVAAAELRSLVEECVQRTGAACVWATHDLHSLPASARRVVLLRGERLIFDGAVEEGLARPSLVEAGLALP